MESKMEADNEVRKLMDYKTRIEERENENQKIRAKLETLLEQAKSRYNVSTKEELEEYRDKLFTSYQTALDEVKRLNNKLDAFFVGL